MMIILRFIIEAPYRQIKYDTMEVEKVTASNKEAEAHGQTDGSLTKIEN